MITQDDDQAGRRIGQQPTRLATYDPTVGEAWVPVGRAAEQRAAENAIGRGCSVLMVGPAGVGKTFLARAVADEAARRRGRGLWLQATASAATAPLAALAPALRANALVEPATAHLAARAIDAICERAADGALVVCDDVHLLDPASASVLAEVARAGTVVLATARTGERLPDALSQLWRAGGAARIEIEPLPPDDAGLLLQAMLGTEGVPDPATAQRLLMAAAGNPLVLRELVLGARARGALALARGRFVLDGPLAFGQALVDIVEERLDRVEDKARMALELVSLAEPIGLTDLEDLTSPYAVESLDALGYLRLDDDERRVLIRLHHPIYGEVMRQRMPATKRRRHLRTLTGQLADHGARRRGDVLRLAMWSLDAGLDVPVDTLVEAETQARFAQNHDLAERLGRAALRAGAGPDAGQVLAEAIYLVGRAQEADDLLAGLDPIDEDQRGLIALQRSDIRFWGLDDSTGARAVLTSALNGTGPGRRTELLASLAQFEGLSGRPATALELVEPILALADRGRPFIHAANAAIPALALAGHCERALALAEEAKEVWERLGDQLAMFDSGILVVAASLALMEAGRLAEARDLTTLGHQLALDAHTAVGQAWMALGLARIALLRGDLMEADARFAEAELAATPGFPGLARWGVSGRLAVAAQRGDVPSCTRIEAELTARSSALQMLDAEVDMALGWSATVRGDRAKAAARFAEAADRAFATGATGPGVAALHEGFRARGAPTGPRGVASTTVERAVAAAATTDSELTLARAEHLAASRRAGGTGLESVAARFTAIGAHLLATEAWQGAAAAHRRAGEARRASRCEQRASESRRLCPDARTPALAPPATGSLTPREQEVVELASQRLATKEIAARLGMKPRTVDNHLHRAYAKLGVGGRADLTD